MSSEFDIDDSGLAETHEQIVEKAVSKIRKEMARNSGYTECIDCGEEIGEERKRILPSATKCVECQSLFDLKNKLYK